MTRLSSKAPSWVLALIAITASAAGGPAGAQQNGQAPGQIPYYWETRPATSAAVVGGLQRSELQCGDDDHALAGSAILCALTGAGSEDDDELGAEQAAETTPAPRIPTFAETVESILTGPR